MTKKAIIKHAVISAVVVAGVAFAAKESDQIRSLTNSESGSSSVATFFSWLTGLFS